MYGYYSQSKAEGDLNLLPNLLAFHLGYHHQVMLKQAELACRSTYNLPSGHLAKFQFCNKHKIQLPCFYHKLSLSIDTLAINKKQVFKMES